LPGIFCPLLEALHEAEWLVVLLEQRQRWGLGKKQVLVGCVDIPLDSQAERPFQASL
jgi:hypothetical protein